MHVVDLPHVCVCHDTQSRECKVCNVLFSSEYLAATSDYPTVAYPGIFFGVGVQQIQLRTEDREDGDLGVVAP